MPASALEASYEDGKTFCTDLAIEQTCNGKGNPLKSNGYNVPPGIRFKNFMSCPCNVFMCFVWISEQTAIISLFSINCLVLITETECVYCAVRNYSLNLFQVSLIL